MKCSHFYSSTFGAHWPINAGGDAEQTNPMKIQIIVGLDDRTCELMLTLHIKVLAGNLRPPTIRGGVESMPPLLKGIWNL